MSNPYELGDPVVDLAQGRPMIVVGTPCESAAEWSDSNGYDLLENYANSRFNPKPGEHVVETVYVSNLQSEPSKTYTFPVSRVKLIDAHHADDGMRIADRVRSELLADLFVSATGAMEPDNTEMLESVARDAGVDEEVLELAQELADVEQTVVADDD